MSVVTRIRRTETLKVPFTPEEVWAVLTDPSAYGEWWPSTFGLRILNQAPGLLGMEWQVRPLLGPTVRIRLEELDEDRNLRLRFFGGLFEGPGGFHLRPEEDGTRIDYAVDVFVRSLVVAAFSLILPLDRLYSLRMRRVLRGLRRRLAKKRRQAERAVLESSTAVASRAEAAAADLRAAEEASARSAEEAAAPNGGRGSGTPGG